MRLYSARSSTQSTVSVPLGKVIYGVESLGMYGGYIPKLSTPPINEITYTQLVFRIKKTF